MGTRNLKLIAARVLADMTQAQLAERVGLSQNDISRLEVSGWIPLAETRQELADALGVTVEDIFDLAKELAS